MADVDAFDASSQGHVDSVIDEERDVGCLGNFMKLLRYTDEIASIADLVSVLNNSCALVDASATAVVVDESIMLPTSFNRGFNHAHEVFVAEYGLR